MAGGSLVARRVLIYASHRVCRDHCDSCREHRLAASTDAYEDAALLPEFLHIKGNVIHGFGRGSKELGCPTANLPVDPIRDVVDGLSAGIYMGWATVSGSDPYKMVMSIGWNPYYKNTEKTVVRYECGDAVNNMHQNEAHLIHEFPEDFYGEELRAVVTGYLRPELDFSSLDELITAIQNDIAEASRRLDERPANDGKSDPYLEPPKE